ncbi:MAG: alpha/beta fold hydrolase [Acidobacteriota bacterium]
MLIILLLMVSLVSLGYSPMMQNPPPATRHLPPDDGNYIVPGVRGDIPYRRVGDVELSMDAYVQKEGGIRPAVVVIHGGNWTSGSRITYVSQFLELLAAAGFNWFSVDYRLGPAERHQEALDDLRAALQFIRAHAGTFRIDPDRIALVGEDTGGTLAALLAAERPAGVKALLTFGASFQLLAEPLSAAVPAGMPSVLAVHGTADKQVPIQEAQNYCKSVRQAGGLCELLPVEGGIHAAENWTPEQWSYKPRVISWLASRLDLKEPNHQPYSTRLQKNIPYGTYMDAAGQKQNLLLDACVPAGRGPFPAVVLVHGGGWEAGDKMTYLTPLLRPLAQAGFAWFSINYRLTPDYQNPDQLEDLRRAIRYVRHQARDFNIDPQRIAILGESAGGQMVVQVAAQPCPGNPDAADPVERQPCSVQALVSFYGVYDFLPLVSDASPRSFLARLFDIHTLDDRARGVLRQYSPLYQVSSDMPPALLIHGTDERLWEQGVRLARKLQELGVPHRLHRLEGAPHGMENWEGRPEWQSYKPVLTKWLSGALQNDERSSSTAWSRHTIDASSRGADGVRLADVNGDGLPDITTAWEQGGRIRVYLNPGPSASRQPWPAVTVGEVGSPEDAVFVDLDGDGAVDVVSASEGDTRSLWVHWAPRDRTEYMNPNLWETEALPAVSSPPSGLRTQASDLVRRSPARWMFSLPLQIDGANGIDLLVGSKNEGATIGWLKSPADRRKLDDWSWHPIYDAGWIMSLFAEDMDSDGDLDIVASDRRGPGRGILWLENPGAGPLQLQPWKEHRIGGADKEVLFMTMADLDQDGALDILAAARNELIYLRQENSPPLRPQWSPIFIELPPGTGTGKAVAVGDIDLDGRLDIVFSCENARDKSGVMWMSYGDSVTDPDWEAHEISGPEGTKYDLVELIDLDGDGDLDVLTCEEQDNLGVIWYENPTVP